MLMANLLAAVMVVCQLRQLLDFCLPCRLLFQCLQHHHLKQPLRAMICLRYELKTLQWPWDLRQKPLSLDLDLHPGE